MYASWLYNFIPVFFSITAISIFILYWSIPDAILLGMEKLVGHTSACISTIRVLEPSSKGNTTVPGAFIFLPSNMNAEGLATCVKPVLLISNTPISLVEPNLFFTLRNILKEEPLSPSKYSTVSTMCSKSLGPAILPSLVTCPTINSDVPERFAAFTSIKAEFFI